MPVFVPLETLNNVTLIVCAFCTPVQLTVTTPPLVLVVAEFAPHVAEPTVTAAGKDTTTVWLPFGPPLRHSIPGVPVRGRLMSNVPAVPCVLRETAPVG